MMDGEQKIILIIAVSVALVLISGIGSCTYYNIEQERIEKTAITEAIAKGTHALDAQCALNHPNSAWCNVRAAK